MGDNTGNKSLYEGIKALGQVFIPAGEVDAVEGLQQAAREAEAQQKHAESEVQKILSKIESVSAQIEGGVLSPQDGVAQIEQLMTQVSTLFVGGYVPAVVVAVKANAQASAAVQEVEQQDSIVSPLLGGSNSGEAQPVILTVDNQIAINVAAVTAITPTLQSMAQTLHASSNVAQQQANQLQQQAASGQIHAEKTDIRDTAYVNQYDGAIALARMLEQQAKSQENLAEFLVEKQYDAVFDVQAFVDNVEQTRKQRKENKETFSKEEDALDLEGVFDSLFAGESFQNKEAQRGQGEGRSR